MLKRLFKKMFAGNEEKIHEEMKNSAIITGLLRGIEENKKNDPLIGAKIAGMQIGHRMIDALKTESGVHMESLLCALGSLAGYSCQASLRAQAIQNGEHENSVFDVIKAIDGKKYFFADSLNKLLVEAEHSVWGLSVAGAQEAGCKDLSDVIEIFKHVSRVIGSKDFGNISVPIEHQPHHRPIEYLKAFWANLLPLLKQFCQQPSEWPIAFGIEIQNVILKGKDVLDPGLSLKIVMESAIQMSKVDIESV